MYKISFIVPEKDMVPLVESVIRQDGAITRNIHNAPRYSYSVQQAQEIQKINREVIDSDVVIARGYMFEELRRKFPNMPLVELPFGSEMTAVIIGALNNHGQKPVAVIGSFNMCYAAQSVRDLFDVDVRAYLLDHREMSEIETMVDQALADGRRIFVCGQVVQECIRSKRYPDVHTHLLGLSRESVLEAITRAKAEMATRKREKERALQFQMLINLSHDGIIATDEEERINVVNRAATELLQLKAPEVMGANIWSVLPAGVLPEATRAGLSAKTVFQLGEDRISLRFGRMIMAGETAGVIVTLQKL